MVIKTLSNAVMQGMAQRYSGRHLAVSLQGVPLQISDVRNKDLQRSLVEMNGQSAQLKSAHTFKLATNDKVGTLLDIRV